MSVPAIEVTVHAATRWCERVDASICPAQAMGAILAHAAAIETAISFGCGIVKLGSGARLLLKGATVITVLGAHQFPPRMAEWQL